MSKKTDEIFFHYCRKLQHKAYLKEKWGETLLVRIDPVVHKQLAILAASYGLSPTKFASQLLTEWTGESIKNESGLFIKNKKGI